MYYRNKLYYFFAIYFGLEKKEFYCDILKLFKRAFLRFNLQNLKYAIKMVYKINK